LGFGAAGVHKVLRDGLEFSQHVRWDNAFNAHLALLEILLSLRLGENLRGLGQDFFLRHGRISSRSVPE
jgi:hypothetical protein